MSRTFRRATVAAVSICAWLVAGWVVAISVDRGRMLQRTDPEVFLGAAPLVGRDFRDGWDWRFGWSILGAAAVAGALVVWCWRGWWFRLRIRWVVVWTALGSMTFAAMLALVDGVDGILYGAEHESEYLANLRVTPSAAEFIRTFTDRIGDYSVHVRGHPPGFVLVLMTLDRAGIGGGWSTALLSLLGTAAVPVGVLVAVHQIAGAGWVRRVAPFLVVSPSLIWMVTSADAVYTGVACLGIAAIAAGVRRSERRDASLLGVSGGLLLGAVMFGTYLGALLLIVPAALVIWGLGGRLRGAPPTLIGALIGGLVVTASFWAAGFWWFDGAAATKDEYWAGTAQFRTWGYFGLANIAAALIALGPAVFAGLLRLRDRRLWLIVGAALVALVSSHLSQYTKGEVERIWLLFYPWITIAAASLFVSNGVSDSSMPTSKRLHRAAIWIAAQGAAALVLQSALVSKW